MATSKSNVVTHLAVWATCAVLATGNSLLHAFNHCDSRDRVPQLEVELRHKRCDVKCAAWYRMDHLVYEEFTLTCPVAFPVTFCRGIRADADRVLGDSCNVICPDHLASFGRFAKTIFRVVCNFDDYFTFPGGI